MSYLKMIDKKFLNKLNIVKKTNKKYEIISNICRTLKVSSLKLLQQPDIQCFYRTTVTKEENIENQALGIIISPILILMVIFLMSLFIYFDYNEEKQIKRIKNGDYKSELGKVKLECKIEDNIIQVYNFFEKWSLVINGNVVYKDIRIMKSKFCLKGRIKINGKNKLVEAMMKSFILKLSFDGKVIKKKFFLVE